jgi:hypothetical protein
MAQMHFEFLVTPQNLRVQREVIYRAVVIVVNDDVALCALAFALVLAFSLVRWGGGRGVFASSMHYPKRPVLSAIQKTQGERGKERQVTHCVDPKAGFRGDHNHPS